MHGVDMCGVSVDMCGVSVADLAIVTAADLGGGPRLQGLPWYLSFFP